MRLPLPRLPALLAACALSGVAPAAAFSPVETPSLETRVAAGTLPPVAERAPADPLIVDLEAKGRITGEPGGTLRTLIAKSKNIRYMVVWGYARLVGYDENYDLKPDLLESVEVEEDRVFTFTLREGHRWSDGHPFTTEDFRYWWEDVANNPDLSPTGPPALMIVDGKPPVFTVLDETRIRYAWDGPNPEFLTALAAARPPFIYRPAHYLRRFHARYTDVGTLKDLIDRKKMRNWAQLHNRYDNLYKNDNPDLPTLHPWVNTTGKKGQHFVMARNPYYHRFDTEGHQLPYIDTVDLRVAASSLFAAKAMVGEVDLLARGLGFSGVPLLKRGEKRQGYHTRLWPTGSSSHIALYPNLNYFDPVWRAVLQDRDFRRALSLGIDRRIVNRTLYFGLAKEVGNAALENSPLFDPANSAAYAQYDPAEANRLLDGMGLTERRGDGTRLLPDGRPLEIIVETAGERSEEIDALELITETWRDIGVKLLARPSDRDILRNRSYAGRTMMTVWTGWDLGVPTADLAPEELAPTMQSTLIWPKWGQHHQTMGTNGDAPDLDPAVELLDLYKGWRTGALRDGSAITKREAWERMLAIHAREQFIIGVVAQAPQPVVVSGRLRNVPETGLYAWEPGAQFGVHRMDEFWFGDRPEETAALE